MLSVPIVFLVLLTWPLLSQCGVTRVPNSVITFVASVQIATLKVARSTVTVTRSTILLLSHVIGAALLTLLPSAWGREGRKVGRKERRKQQTIPGNYTFNDTELRRKGEKSSKRRSRTHSANWISKAVKMFPMNHNDEEANTANQISYQMANKHLSLR